MKQQINGWKREMKLNIKSLFGNIDNKNSETLASYVEHVSSLEDNPAQTISLKKRFLKNKDYHHFFFLGGLNEPLLERCSSVFDEGGPTK